MSHFEQTPEESLKSHVDAVIGNDGFKRGLQERADLNNSNTTKREANDSPLKDDTHGGNTSLHMQMAYQSDF